MAGLIIFILSETVWYRKYPSKDRLSFIKTDCRNKLGTQRY